MARQELKIVPITTYFVGAFYMECSRHQAVIFVGQSLYLFEVRHNPAKDFNKAHVCFVSTNHVIERFNK